MALKEPRHGEIRAADVVILSGIICLALTTWPEFSRSAGIPSWKPYFSSLVTIWLALSALTRDPRLSAAMKLATGAWVVATPFFLGFADLTSSFWSYLGIGALIIGVTIPGLRPYRIRRLGGQPIHFFVGRHEAEGHASMRT